MITHEHDAVKVIVCSHVAEDGHPVREVIHARRGDWQFLCGGDDHSTADTARVACWTCMLAQDASLGTVSELNVGTWASRDGADGAWQFYVLEDETAH